MTPHPDTERLRYEIQAKCEKIGVMTYWPNNMTQCDIWKKWAFYHNSIGKRIGAFRLKSWK